MEKKCTRVLLIEDDTEDYRLIRRALGKARTLHELHWADSLASGLAMLASSNFDVVLTDLNLADCHGLEAVRAIRACNNSVAVIVMTTLDDSKTEFESLNVGAQDFLVKSEANSHTLARIIHHAIHRQQNLIEIERLLAEVNANRELLSEQKALLESKNRRLRKIYKTAHRFVDNVSHEFRTPLTVIKDYVSLVREGMVGAVNDEQAHMLDIVGVRADDLNNMVDDMLDVSKLESGMLGAWRRNCRLTDIVQAVRPALQKKAEVKAISFEIAVDENLPEVYCDGEKAGRVIINLVTNAMKFCGDPGSVRLWAKENHDKHELVVGVTDNGAGIDESGLAQLFQRFKQLDTNIKSSTKGFGLGLNIAKELVELNFGEMHVESQLKQGSTFSFTIPLADPLEVLRRYLERLERMRNGSSVVSLVWAETENSDPDASTEDADTFFNFLLQRNDLLFRCGVNKWLYVLPTRSEVDQFLVRAEQEFEKTNRNRPYGPLPSFVMNIAGSWRLSTDRDTILEYFRNIVGPSGEVPDEICEARQRPFAGSLQLN
jgi:signal transduction histidine kinase